MKGVSKFVTYAFITLFGFVVLAIFTGILYTFYDKVLKTNISAGLRQIAVETVGQITKAYDTGKNSDSKPENSSAIVLVDLNLNYPEKISGKNYEILLVSSPGIWTQIKTFQIDNRTVTPLKEVISGSKVLVRTTQIPLLTYELPVPNIPIYLEGGYRSGENSTLRYVRYNYNGSVNDTIILGESNIILGITKVQ